MKHYILALVLAMASINAAIAANPIREGNMISGHVIVKGTDFETKMPGIYIQKIQAFLNLMTMKKEREEREGKGYVSLPP